MAEIHYEAKGTTINGSVVRHGQGVPSIFAQTFCLKDAETIAAALNEIGPMRAELAAAEPILVAADRVREACDAVSDGRDPGRLPDWERALTLPRTLAPTEETT